MLFAVMSSKKIPIAAKSEAGFCYVLLEERRDFLRQPVMCGALADLNFQNAINFQLSQST